jgi:hypothetical protein
MPDYSREGKKLAPGPEISAKDRQALLLTKASLLGIADAVGIDKACGMAFSAATEALVADVGPDEAFALMRGYLDEAEKVARGLQ